MSVAGLVAGVGDRWGRDGPIVRMLRPIYGHGLQAVYGRRGLPWSINGEPIRISPNLRHLLPRRNEASLFRFLSEQVRPGDVVFDIGAFLGSYAILEARRAGPAGRVWAFEPSPDTFAALERHLLMNGLHAPGVVARQAAVGARAGRRRMMAFDDEPYRNALAPGDAANAAAVDVVTVDDVANEFGRPPDWIRMDVQGFEFDVLHGAASVLKSGRLVRIVAEMHPEQWPDLGIQPHEAADRLAALGLRARPVVPDGDPFEQSGHAVLEPLR